MKCSYIYCKDGIRDWRGYRIPCPDCTTLEMRKDCENCGGSGKVHSHNDECWVCDGLGWVLK